MAVETTIKTIEQLAALYGEANPLSLRKELTRLSAPYRRWIEAAPFFAIATSGAGGLDCSPRGDPAGQLFQVLDDKTIAIPDRRGNNRLDTLKNIIGDPRVALLFLLPGINECVRINGRAELTTGAAMRERFAIDGKLPMSVIVVTIDSVYFQCARALLRAKLWDASAQVARDAAPTAGEMMQAADASFDGGAYDAILPERQKSSLY
jgi:PPOX class probable FMN-dependent enzyme